MRGNERVYVRAGSTAKSIKYSSTCACLTHMLRLFSAFSPGSRERYLLVMENTLWLAGFPCICAGVAESLLRLANQHWKFFDQRNSCVTWFT